MQARGYTLIEVLIAVSLASLITAALSETLINAYRARGRVVAAGEAARLAEAGLEQLAACGRTDPAPAESPFTRSGRLELWDARHQLYRAEVAVRSQADPALAVELVTVVKR
ncbi:MAG TPA: type II secretion system protein [Terriglobales bacterium]|nr:type II secretion system protein [Terriglobales bacterium]